MLYQIQIPFTSREGIRYCSGTASLFHGLLMEQLSPEYAAFLHEDALRPFSQSVTPEEQGGIWTVSVLTKEACEQIIPPLLSLKEAEIQQKEDVLTFGKAEERTVTYPDLFRSHYIQNDPPRLAKLYFDTPTAFKSAGRYVNMPTARLILSGLVKRYDSTCGIHDTIYDTLFEDIEQQVTVAGFRIHSTSFPVEHVKIPAFMGSVTLRIGGNTTFRSYIHMLCDYAQYAGVGIKSALGMGHVRYEKINK